MAKPDRANPAARLGGATMMAAGLLFVALWATDHGSPSRLVLGGVLLVVGIFYWRRGGRPPSAG